MGEREVTSDFDVDLRAVVRGLKSARVDDGLWWPSHTPDGPGTMRLTGGGRTIHGEAWGSGGDWLLEQMPRLLGFEDELEGFDPVHPALRDQHRRHPARCFRSDRVFEALLPAILGQKVQTVAARRSLQGIVRAFGEDAPGPRDGLRMLPTPERLAECGYYDLHPFGVERKRAMTIIRAAAHASRLERVPTLAPDVGDRLLTSIRGIGPWTVALVRASACGDADAVPVGDYHIPNHVAWALAGEPRGDDARMLELLEPFAGHRGRVIRLIKGAGLTAPKFGPRLSIQEFAEF